MRSYDKASGSVGRGGGNPPPLRTVFGDFSGYYARFAGPIRIERSDDFAFLNDLVTFKFVMRADGDLIDLSAVKHFLGAAS